jgi:hypothetical protein
LVTLEFVEFNLDVERRDFLLEQPETPREWPLK